jgi:hypothetical protein
MGRAGRKGHFAGLKIKFDKIPEVLGLVQISVLSVNTLILYTWAPRLNTTALDMK